MPARVSFRSNFNLPCRHQKLSVSRYFSTTAPCSSTTDAQKVIDNKAFTKTLLLPKTAFPLRVDPKEIEASFQKLSCDELYKWQSENAKGPVFVLHDGPPYANGDLHMGHALNKVVKDIINRFHLSRGRKVHYVPGWDCHGLPIENKALKDMKRDSLDTPASVIRQAAETTALREIESQREQFRLLGIMADWDSKETTYRTLDRHYVMRQLRIFQKMVEKGLIYRQHRPVHYSPSSRSALAEAELEYKDDHVSHSVYVTFDVDRNAKMKNHTLQEILSREPRVQLLVWTTTPWTLTANMGIAVHNDLEYDIVRWKNEASGDGVVIVAHDRLEALSKIIQPVETLGTIKGSDLVGISYKPIFPSPPPSSSSSPLLKIIPASHVTALSGTGLVHCAPSHGAEDYAAFRSLGLISSSLQMICHVDHRGAFTPDIAEVVGEEAAKKLVGKEVLGEGNKEMVGLLKELGSVVKVERLKHRYPYDWKTKEPIIVTATSQWFANLDDIKDNALGALKEVAFFPEASRNRLESFIRSRSEWCISRQRVWGVPIPALHHRSTGAVVLDFPTLDFILNALESNPALDWWKSPIEAFVPPHLLEDGKTADETWEKGKDTMDVWFDSGTSWSMLGEMGVANTRGGDGTRRFDADLCLEGSDQHRGWFQSQLLTAIGSADAGKEAVSPYGGLITHGMVLDEKGKKMSKSLGNIVSPMTIVNGGPDKKTQPAYGADVLRLWAATVEYWRDMSIGPTVIAQAAESMRKLRNSARFCLGNMGDKETLKNLKRVKRSEMGLAERYIMHELYTLEQIALEGYASYNFPQVITSLNNFANITLSSLYFDITKDNLYANSIDSFERRAVVTVLEKVLGTLSNVMAPVLPYLAEEINVIWKGDDKSVFMTPWTPLGDEWKDPQAAEDMSDLLLIRGHVLSLLEKARGQKQIKSALEAEVDIILPYLLTDDNHIFQRMINREENFFKTLFIVSDVSILDGEQSIPKTSPEWSYTQSFRIPDIDEEMAVRVRPATRQKCPRCWTFTRPKEDVLCGRCADVVEQDHGHS
ncbi:tRNA synthetases class I-domain-containing protein [Crassisporium funariophilum]|nr:tRNA synthetases class I-domain-containing protein [Crassisporium funariophilum]